MSAEIHRPPAGRARRTYFVGRRPHEQPEVYAVTEDDVRRLRPDRHGEPLALDWHADARSLALGHALLARVARRRPPRELEERFALEVLAALPDERFVLGSDAILDWLDEASEPEDHARSKPPRWSPPQRLLAVLHFKTKAPVTDG